MITRKGKYTTATIMTDEIEDSALEQIDKMTNHVAFTNPMVVMPDVHAGVGSVIGFTMKLGEKVIPNIIGVDIGCSLFCLSIVEGLEDCSYAQLDNLIREHVPFGQNVHDIAPRLYEDFWVDVKQKAWLFSKRYEKEFNKSIKEYMPDYKTTWFMEKCKQVGVAYEYAIHSIGTLGGGNHFIEIGDTIDTHDKRKWLTVHTGSRNLGYKIANYWQNVAHEKLNKIDKDTFSMRLNALKMMTYDKRQLPNKIKKLKEEFKMVGETPNKELEYLEDIEDIAGYLFDMIFAQEYARMNREEIVDIIQRETSLVLNWEQAIESVHNYIDFEDLIVRKGAISSYENKKMLIPFNMKDGMLICKGKSNPDWNFSAPHGAGRVMSRSEARRTLDVDEFTKTMSEVFSTSVGISTIDESPMAYKSPIFIKKAIEPTARVSVKIRPLMNLKDNGERR